MSSAASWAMVFDALGRETVARRREYGAAFRSAEPFPHVVIDGFFDAAFLEQLVASFPPFERGHHLDETGRPGGKEVIEDIRAIDAAYAAPTIYSARAHSPSG